jgi:predicted kinase
VEAARALGVTVRVLLCRTSRDEVSRRLAGRTGDASDADLSIHDAAAARFEPPGAVTAPITDAIDANAGPAVVLERALTALCGAELARDSEQGPRVPPAT